MSSIPIQVIYGGEDAFNALVYSSEQNPVNTNYFQNQINSISNSLSSIGQTFFANTQAIYNQINNSEALRIARAAVSQAKTLFQPNRIIDIRTMENMQNAPVVMQRWIMANPLVREMYHKQQIDGYSDSYKDMFPNQIGENHYDYRRVMDSVVQDSSNDDEWFVRYYPDEILEGDKELSHDEKVSVLNTWSIAEMFVKAGKSDPTSVWDSQM